MAGLRLCMSPENGKKLNCLETCDHDIEDWCEYCEYDEDGK